MAGVLVFGERNESGLSRASLQVAAAGASVAEALGEPLLGALIGADLGACGKRVHVRHRHTLSGAGTAVRSRTAPKL